MKNIGIFGIGSIGSVLAKYLNQNLSNRVFYFNRSKKDKIYISHNDDITSIPIQLSSGKMRDLDWLIVCLKEYHYKNAISQIKLLVNPKTKIAVFRNGLNLSTDFMAFTDRRNVLETIIDCSTQKNKEGNYIQLNIPRITVPQTSLAKDFINLIGESEIELIQTTKFKEQQWKKLIETSSLGSIQALKGQTCSVFKDKIILAEYTKLITEGIKVAQSEGIEINMSFADSLLEKTKKYPPTKGSSMLTDKLAGNQLELEAKIGVILQTGLSNKIKIPTTQRVYNAFLPQI